MRHVAHDTGRPPLSVACTPLGAARLARVAGGRETWVACDARSFEPPGAPSRTRPLPLLSPLRSCSRASRSLSLPKEKAPLPPLRVMVIKLRGWLLCEDMLKPERESPPGLAPLSTPVRTPRA